MNNKIKKINIWIAWMWTVWSEVFNIIYINKENFSNKVWNILSVSWIYTRNPSWPKSRDIYEKFWDKFKLSIDEVIDNSQIIVETMWWINEAKLLIEQALNKWKSVVTANKDLMATFGSDLLEIANKNNAFLKYEASVAWWIPIINTLENWLSWENIIDIKWIINWTCNYILTELQKNPKMSFNEILKVAQDKWYAEKNPTNDIEWIDAWYKLSILSKACFWRSLWIDEIIKQWISQIDWIDFEYLDILKSKVKLLWIIEKTKNNALLAIVAPFIISNDHQLSNIDWVLNAINVKWENTETFYAWPWAWWRATASAIVSDIMNIVKCPNANVVNNIVNINDSKISLEKQENIEFRYYCRFVIKDGPWIISKISTIFADKWINIDQVLQHKHSKEEKENLPFIITLEKSNELKVKEVIKEIQKQPFIKEKILLIRMLDE